MDVDELATLKPTSFISKVKKEQASASPAPTSSTSISSKSLGRKVTRGDFSHDVGALADAAKELIRTRICFGSWISDSDTSNKLDWIWSIIKETPALLGPSCKQTARLGLITASKDPVVKANLITYVCLFFAYMYMLTSLLGGIWKRRTLQ